jgi:hypothetical protein
VNAFGPLINSASVPPNVSRAKKVCLPFNKRVVESRDFKLG